MATLVLGVAGAAIASAVAGSATTVVFAGMTAATVGFTVGSMIGAVIDSYIIQPALFSPDFDVSTNVSSTTVIEGSRMGEMLIPVSNYGEPVPLVYGKQARVNGILVWMSRIEEVVNVETSETVTESRFEYESK